MRRVLESWALVAGALVPAAVVLPVVALAAAVPLGLVDPVPPVRVAVVLWFVPVAVVLRAVVLRAVVLPGLVDLVPVVPAAAVLELAPDAAVLPVAAVLAAADLFVRIRMEGRPSPATVQAQLQQRNWTYDAGCRTWTK